MKKDILIICQYFYPEYISSATLPYDTAIKLSQSGYSVDVLTGYPKEYINNNSVIKKKEIIDNIVISRVKYLTLSRKKKIGRLVNYISFTFSIILKLTSLRKYKYIFVYSNPPLLPYVAYLGNKLYKLKIIFVLYDIYPEIALYTGTIAYNSIMHRSMNYINEKIYKNLTKLVVLSEDMKVFVEKNRDIKKENIYIIENWYKKIDTDRILKNSKFIKFKKLEEDKRFKLVYTGNLGIAQDSDFLIDFIKINQNNDKISFVIAGHGNKIVELKRLQNSLNFNNLYIFDYLHSVEYEKLLLISDAFILSLKKELSGLASPSKLYSYLAAGKPILAIIEKNSHLAKLIINKKIGIVSVASNYIELTESIISLYQNKSEYEQMCINVYNTFIEFYETNVATDKYVKLVKDLEEEQKYER